MKVLIAYYSRTGKTKELAEIIADEFRNRGHSVDIERIIAAEEHSFFGWFYARFFKQRQAGEILEPEIKDVSRYDAICIGSPNWARLSLPVTRYLQQIEGLKFKNVGLFSTTFFWPFLEWYIISAYLLELTFSNLIIERGGRPIVNILLSSAFKNWGVKSEYGKKAVEKFCSTMETPVLSYKEYGLVQKEIGESRSILTLFFAFFPISLFLYLVLSALGLSFLNWYQYLSFFIIYLFACFIILELLRRKQSLYRIKYVAIASLSLSWTLLVIFLQPIFNETLVLGYILISIFTIFFQETKTVLFTGIVTFLGYLFLLLFIPQEQILHPLLDILFLWLSLGLVAFISQNTKKYFVTLIELQDEVEAIRATFGIRVSARSRELREIVASLDEQVKERTKELQEKVETLEKINQIAVDRELKMIELKKENEQLKSQLVNKNL